MAHISRFEHSLPRLDPVPLRGCYVHLYCPMDPSNEGGLRSKGIGLRIYLCYLHGGCLYWLLRLQIYLQSGQAGVLYDVGYFLVDLIFLCT